MSLKPKPPRPMPAEMAELGAKLLPADSPYRLVGDQLYEQYHEADYADMYPAEGQPALSPVDLALVTAFQSMEDLSDRQAAEAVRLRLDWKYALHQPVDYEGFNFSVLSEFRARVIQHGAEARVFEAVLGQLQALGLLKRRGRQRTDSAAVLTKVRHLNRLELVVETLRLAVRALLTADPTWTQATVPPTWAERYGTRCVAERLNDQQRAALQAAVGPDGQWSWQSRQHPPRWQRCPRSRPCARCGPSSTKCASGRSSSATQDPTTGPRGSKVPMIPRPATARSAGRAGWGTSCRSRKRTMTTCPI